MSKFSKICYFSAKQNAKRLHGRCLSVIRLIILTRVTCRMFNPSPSFLYPISMTKATKSNKRVRKGKASSTKINNLEKQVAQLTLSRKTKKATPFANTGGIIGRKVGGMFGNASMGAGVGRWLGTGIGSIFGSGDYQVTGAQPKYNVLANGSQVPQFSTTHSTNIVCHREYLGDIVGTAGFNNVMYPLNPGLTSTFPWLSTIAVNYQQYRFHGVMFEFRPLITDFVTAGAPGVVIMATNYNADAPIYTTKQQMENSEFATSVKPTLQLVHGVECAIQETPLAIKYVRSGAVPVGQDLRLYDLGNYQFATQANPVQDLGELYVTYCVEFFKPILPVTGANAGPSFHSVTSPVTNALPLGVVQTRNNGAMRVSMSPTVITVRQVEPAQPIMVSIVWFGAAPGAWVLPGVTLGGCSNFGYFGTGPANPVFGGAGTTELLYTIELVSTSTIGPQDFTITFDNAGTMPTVSCDVVVTTVPIAT